MSISGVGSYAAYSPTVARGSAKDRDATAFTSLIDVAAKDASQPTSGGAQQTDFTHMTRKDLADWVNSRIRSGEMTLDGTEGFLGMTMKIPVNGAYTGLDDTEQVNFMQMAQDGMGWARQHSDADMLASLQAAIGTMQRYQGQIGSVDLKA